MALSALDKWNIVVTAMAINIANSERCEGGTVIDGSPSIGLRAISQGNSMPRKKISSIIGAMMTA